MTFSVNAASRTTLNTAGGHAGPAVFPSFHHTAQHGAASNIALTLNVRQ
jgi:hypothetical protein